MPEETEKTFLCKFGHFHYLKMMMMMMIAMMMLMRFCATFVNHLLYFNRYISIIIIYPMGDCPQGYLVFLSSNFWAFIGLFLNDMYKYDNFLLTRFPSVILLVNLTHRRTHLGKDPGTKSDDFLEKFQTAFDPPPSPSFLENYVANFFIMDMVAYMQVCIGQIVSVNIS